MENVNNSSKELLLLEHKTSSTIETALLVCGKKKKLSHENNPPRVKPVMSPVGQSQVLGRVKDFLGIISEANERLQQDAKDSAHDYDIEALTGNESHVIEMDLMLGIADLNTPEAVAAAESAMDGNQPLFPLDADTESESTSDDGDDDDKEEEKEDDNRADDDTECCDEEDCQRSSSLKETSISFDKDGSFNRLKKRPKIIEMS